MKLISRPYRSFTRFCLAWLTFTWFCAPPVDAGILDAVHVRAKTDHPLEADQAGYEVILIDTHSDTLLVGGDVVVPESFGKVDAAELIVIDPAGRRIGFATLAPGFPARKTPYFEFSLASEYLKNSVVGLTHLTSDSLDMAVVHLGTFALRDLKSKNTPPPPPKTHFVLAEQGLYGDNGDEFTVTDKVPLTEGQAFGFRLCLSGAGRSVSVRIEQTLPRPPKTWGSAAAVAQMKISEDGCTASATEQVPTGQLLYPRIVIADGDPEGDYVFKVFVSDELMKTFVFHVQRTPPKPDETP